MWQPLKGLEKACSLLLLDASFPGRKYLIDVIKLIKMK